MPAFLYSPEPRVYPCVLTLEEEGATTLCCHLKQKPPRVQPAWGVCGGAAGRCAGAVCACGGVIAAGVYRGGVCVCRGGGDEADPPPAPPAGSADVSVSSSIGSAAAASRTPHPLPPTAAAARPPREGHPRVPGMVAAAGG